MIGRIARRVWRRLSAANDWLRRGSGLSVRLPDLRRAAEAAEARRIRREIGQPNEGER